MINMAVHVFIDNSNIWISLQNLCRKLEGVPPVAVRVYLKNLEDYVVRGRKTGVKWIAGSIPPEAEDFIRLAKEMGYDTKFLKRVPEGNTMREQGVDMQLQLQMSRTLNRFNSNEVMAVLTGDSHVDVDSEVSFIEVIGDALKMGWTVEVYAVKDSISETLYQPLKDQYGDSLQIEYLDDVYQSITFVKEGNYYFPEDPENLIHVDKRLPNAKTW